VFADFGQAMALVRFEAYFAESTYWHIRGRTQETLRQPPGIRGLPRLYMGVAVPARDLSKGEPWSVAIGGRDAEDEGFIKVLVSSLNKQFCWSLAQAHEAYESFLKDTFAWLGYLDPTLWTCEHFGSIRITDVRKQSLEWFQARVRNAVARHDAKAVLAILRERFPELKKLERDNYAGRDYPFWLSTVALLRHAVVHSRGFLKLPSLWRSLSRATGVNMLAKKGKAVVLRRRVRAFLKRAPGGHEVWLVDKRKARRATRTSLWCPLEHLLDLVADHACLVYVQAVRHFGRDPVWERGER